MAVIIISRLEGSEITVLATARVQKAMAIQARRVADELSRISAGACANARLLDVSEAILDVLTQMNEQGMAIDTPKDRRLRKWSCQTSARPWPRI